MPQEVRLHFNRTQHDVPAHTLPGIQVLVIFNAKQTGHLFFPSSAIILTLLSKDNIDKYSITTLPATKYYLHG